MLEGKNAQLRAEVARWRERAKHALASERLVQLKSGLPSSMVPPSVAPSPLKLLNRDRDPYREVDPSHNNPDDPVRLRAQIAYWQGEAEAEKARQRGFHEALWASETFSQGQKVKATTWLRQPPPAAAHAADHANNLRPPSPPPPPFGAARAVTPSPRAVGDSTFAVRPKHA